MGLLDEAIREHLELKRRRGADTTEVARQEQEAFGPPRRTEFDVAPADGYAPDEPALEEPAAAFAAEQPTELHTVEETLPVVQREPAEPAPPPPVHEPAQPTREFDAGELHAATAPEPEAEPEPDEEPEPAAPPAPRADEEQSSEDPEDADVLEETPEFLQETPEHDRLWFEQRPPRDFDF